MKKKLLSLLLTAALLLSVAVVTAVPARAASTMKASEECIKLLKQIEGFLPKPIWDVSQYSVGYGSRCEETDYPDGITEEEADGLLRGYVAQAEQNLNYFIDTYSLNLTQYQFDALTLFSYNCGTGWIYSAGTFRNAVTSGATGNEFLNAIVSWCKANETIYPGLITRRLAEANLYFNGVYSTAAPSQYCHVIFNGNGGVVRGAVVAFESNTTLAVTSTASRTDYNFLGWYTKTTGGDQVTTLTSALSGKTIFARWQKIGSSTPEEPVTTPVSYDGTVTASSLNVREEPGTYASVLKVLLNGASVSIVGEQVVGDVTWGKLSTGGWVSLSYIKKAETTPPETNPPETNPPETNPPETTPPETTPEPTTPAFTPYDVVVTGSVVNTRKGPGTSNALVSSVKSGQKLTIVAEETVSGVAWGKTSDGAWLCLTYTKKASETAAPTTPSTGTTVTVTSGTVNVRSGAGTGNGVISSVYKGNTLTIVETQTVSGALWGKLSSGGWICLQYTNYSASGSSGSSGGSSGSTGTSQSVTVTGSVVNVRSGAGTGNGVISAVYKGNTVTIVETASAGGTTWGKLSSGGWISLQYTTYSASGSSSSGGSSSGGASSGGTSSGGSTSGTVNASSLRIRSTAGMSGSVVGSLSNGASVEILEQKTADGMTWGRISSGWISMSYVSVGSSGGGSSSSGGSYKVTGSVVNVRSGAGTGSSVISSVKRGETVTIVATASANGMTWGQLSSGGWISMNYVA